MIALRLQDGKNFPKNTFLDDVKDMLTRAQAHSISIIPTLWSFEAMSAQPKWRHAIQRQP